MCSIDMTEFLDKLAGRPWVRLRAIAAEEDTITDHWSERYNELEREAVDVWGEATGNDLSNMENFGFGAEHWRHLADRIEEEDGKDRGI